MEKAESLTHPARRIGSCVAATMENRILTETTQSLRLAGPLILAQLATTALGFIDTIMVGRLGQEQLAAVALGSAIFFPLEIVCIGVLTSVSPMVSQAFGARKPAEAGRATRQGLWLTVFLSVPAFFLLINIEPILALLGQEPSVRANTAAYLSAMAYGFPAAVGFSAFRNFVEGYGRTRPVMLITFLGVACNIVADYGLMFGRWGLPAMGLVGTGWASVVVYWTMLLSIAVYISRETIFESAAVFSRLGRPDWSMFRELLRIGLPAGALMGIEAGLFATTAILMGLLGSVVLASHQIALQCAAVAFMVPLGISLATSIRVGHAIGRGDPSGARFAGYIGMLLGAGFMTCTAILFWLFPRPIISLYLPVQDPQNREVVELAVSLLGIAAVFQVFDGLQVTAAGALRGLKDTKVPMIVGLISYWLVGLSSGCVMAFVFDRGAHGLWWGLVIGLALAGILLFRRFHTLVGGNLTASHHYPQSPETTSTS